ncbi:hypothetical protein [Piscirickettsia salmonis]|nr:hypothetical protein [Piscirickettsia salmonis]
MLGDFASLDVQNTYRGSDAYEQINNFFKSKYFLLNNIYTINYIVII